MALNISTPKKVTHITLTSGELSFDYLYYCFDFRPNYLLNDKLTSVENADVVLLVGTNPRYEAPVFNARIRKSFLHTEVEVGLIGSQVDLTYDYEYLGDNAKSVEELVKGSSDFAKKLQAAKNPVIVVGVDSLKGADGAKLQGQLQQLSSKLRQNGAQTVGFNVLQRNAAQVAALDIGYKSLDKLTPEEKKQIRFLYLLGSDDSGLKVSVMFLKVILFSARTSIHTSSLFIKVIMEMLVLRSLTSFFQGPRTPKRPVLMLTLKVVPNALNPLSLHPAIPVQTGRSFAP